VVDIARLAALIAAVRLTRRRPRHEEQRRTRPGTVPGGLVDLGRGCC
jgi:hypothetical protein